MLKQKIVEDYFDASMYSNQEILQRIEETKKEFSKKIVNVDINLNEFGVYVVTYYFKNKENLFQKIVVKIKQRKKKKQMLLLQEKQFELHKKEIKKQRKKENKQKNHIEKAKRKNKTREEKNKEKLQKRNEKYTGNKYGKYKETKTYRTY